MSSDLKAQFAKAKEHIDAGRYADARKMLATINHPTARQWETKLDALQPAAKPAPPLPLAAKVVFFGLMILAGGLFAIAAATAFSGQSDRSDLIRAQVRARINLEASCVSRASLSTEFCRNWADGIAEQYAEIVLYCERTYDSNARQRRYELCLEEEGVSLLWTP